MATKKTTRRAPARKATEMVARPVHYAHYNHHEKTAATPCACGCRGGFWKKLILAVLIFALGWAACCWLGCCCHDGKKMSRKMWKFNEAGCLKMDAVKCPEFAAKIAAADADANGCITKIELRDWKMAKRAEHRADRYDD
jgi:hypothetical protein